MKYYNKNQIVSIDLLDEEESLNIRYQKENKGFLGFFKVEEGFYKNGIRPGTRYKIDKIPENHYQKDNIIFIKPRIIINYSGIKNDYRTNTNQVIYFNNNKERNIYFKRNFSDLNLIN